MLRRPAGMRRVLVLGMFGQSLDSLNRRRSSPLANLAPSALVRTRNDCRRASCDTAPVSSGIVVGNSAAPLLPGKSRSPRFTVAFVGRRPLCPVSSRRADWHVLAEIHAAFALGTFQALRHGARM